MNINELIQIIYILAPIITTLTAFFILWMQTIKSAAHIQTARTWALLYLGCALNNWINVFLFYYFPNLFVYLNWYVYLTFILAQIFFYAIIFHLTRTGSNERFSPIHFAMPVLVATVAIIASIVTPYDEQLRFVLNKEILDTTPSTFQLIMKSRFPVRFLFTVVYTTFAFIRLLRYRKTVTNYSSNSDQSTLFEVRLFLWLSIALLPIPILGTIIEKDIIMQTFLAPIQVLILAIQFACICHYLPQIHPLPDPDDDITDTDKPLLEDTTSLKKELLSKQLLEEYLHTYKPHHNPDFKITDLTEPFNMNRTYISSFINNEYGMNFNNFINQLRVEEYSQLRENPIYQNSPNKDLATMVGFNNYRNLTRFLQKEST